MEENLEQNQRLIAIYTHLLNLGYVGRIETIQDFASAFAEGEINKLFYDIVTWLSSRLATMLRLDGRITVELEGSLRAASLQETLTDPLAFLVEMSSLLNELRCPIQQLTKELIASRLKSAQTQLQVIEYLVQELQAAKMMTIKSPEVEKEINVVELEESRTAKELRELFITLNLSKPPKNLNVSKMFNEIEKRICTLSQPLLPSDVIRDALFSGVLTESQWFSLQRLYGEFCAEYRNRREIAITRASVTISSFLWKDSIKKMSADITVFYNEFTRVAQLDPDVEIADILTATADLAIGERVSSDAARRNTRGVAHSITMISPPDRGGRPNEQRPPPPEIPDFKIRIDPNNRNRNIFTMSFPRQTPPRERPIIDIRSGGDPGAQLLVLPAAPVMQNPGDNFGHFGHPNPVVIGQPAFGGAGVLVAPANMQFQRGGAPQGNHGLYAGRGLFEGHGANRGAYGGGEHDDRGERGSYGAHGQYDNRGQHQGGQRRGGRSRRVRRVQYGRGRQDGFGGYSG